VLDDLRLDEVPDQPQLLVAGLLHLLVDGDRRGSVQIAPRSAGAQLHHLVFVQLDAP
jgi:hypothetical protein